MPEAHTAVPQLDAPSADVGVLSRLAPKLSPVTVRLHPAVMPAFARSTKLTTGAVLGQVGVELSLEKKKMKGCGRGHNPKSNNCCH